MTNFVIAHWIVLKMLKAKTYYIYREKRLYGKKRYFLVDKIRIECVGGDSMSEEKELVFIEPNDVPRLLRGATSRKWSEIFNKIPKNKVLVMAKEDYGSAPNIRGQVKKYNEINDNALTATQRTDSETEEVTVYVQRVK